MRKLFSVIVPVVAVGLIIGAAAFAPARAWDKSQYIRPGQAETIKLGYVNGTAYYTAERDGFHVVATLSVAEGAPLRFSATLQPEQSITVSVPGPEGETPKHIEIVRRGDNLTVTRPLHVVLN